MNGCHLCLGAQGNALLKHERIFLEEDGFNKQLVPKCLAVLPVPFNLEEISAEHPKVKKQPEQV